MTTINLEFTGSNSGTILGLYADTRLADDLEQAGLNTSPAIETSVSGHKAQISVGCEAAEADQLDAFFSDLVEYIRPTVQALRSREPGRWEFSLLTWEISV